MWCIEEAVIFVVKIVIKPAAIKRVELKKKINEIFTEENESERFCDLPF